MKVINLKWVEQEDHEGGWDTGFEITLECGHSYFRRANPVASFGLKESFLKNGVRVCPLCPRKP